MGLQVYFCLTGKKTGDIQGGGSGKSSGTINIASRGRGGGQVKSGGKIEGAASQPTGIKSRVLGITLGGTVINFVSQLGGYNGRAVHHLPIVIQKTVDGTSARLLQIAGTREPIEVMIEFVKTGSSKSAYVLNLTKSIIGGIRRRPSVQPDRDSGAIEEITFVNGSIQTSFNDGSISALDSWDN